MLEPTSQGLLTSAWTVRPAGDLSHVPEAIAREPIAAQVPGCVHMDLLRARLIAHPDHGMAELDQLWIGRTDWEYHCTFDADESLFGHDRIDLVFECLDTIATITLNGVEVGRAASAFIPHRFDTRRLLHRGTNELVVTFTGPINHIYAEDARLGPLPRNGDWDPFNTIRKPACDFGWDWGPKTATSGISGPVSLEAWSYVRLEHVRPLARRVSEREWTVEVNARLNWTGPPRDEPVVLMAHLEMRAPEEGPTRYAQAASISVAMSHANVTLRVGDPTLWWPRGYGEPALHDLTVTLQSADGSHTFGSWRGRIGFRTIELDTTPDEHGERFVFRVNGREVFCIGANCIPIASFEFEGRDSWVRASVIAAQTAGMNMLRVWGGGRYESDSFYRDCDEAGIMVWQDFMFACALYAEEEPLGSLVEREAKHQVTRLSSHPSVVLWCGGNETVWGYQRWGWKQRVPEGRTWGATYWTRLLPSIVSELDPTRPYWSNSPWSGSLDRDVLDPDRGDRHTWDSEFEGYRTTVPRFLSEFGRQGPANYSTLARAVGPANLRIGSREFDHRQRATGGTAKVIDEAIEKYFGKADRSFDEWHYLAQLLQARAVKIGVSWARCNRPRCSGVLVWQLNDVWACPSWSLVDVDGRKKPAWFAFRRAAAPRACFFHNGPDGAGPAIFAVNDTDEAWQATATVRRVRLDGRECARGELRISIDARAAAIIGDAPSVVGRPDDPRREILVLDFPKQLLDGRETWLFVPDRELHEGPARFRTTLEVTQGQPACLHIESENVVRDMIIQIDRVFPNATANDQVITILPGERARFSFIPPVVPGLSFEQDLLELPPVLWCANGRGRS